jgi:DNA repair exonuclease SbcCD ATPase subunit
MELIDTPDELGNELNELDRRKELLSQGYQKLAGERLQLQPIKDLVAAREAAFTEEQASLDGEGQEIADAFAELRRRVRDSRRAADRAFKMAQRQAAADRKQALADLKTLERDIDEISAQDADIEDNG